MTKQREIWIDRVKIFACVFVVIGHFSQSMVASGFLPDNAVYQWFFNALYVYSFHVPLFFICSGYLYQKHSRVNSFKEWGNNVLRKTVALGIPYAVFTFATWLLKSVFSSSVNYENESLVKTLFVDPISPYWYLYILFFFFVIFVTIDTKTDGFVLLAITLFLRFVGPTDIYVLSLIMEYGVWFVLGMLIAFYDIPKYVAKQKRFVCIGVVSGVLYPALSVAAHIYNVIGLISGFFIGITACLAVLCIAIYFETPDKKPLLKRVSGYIMPLFLLHTIFAAGLRAVLIKIGVENPAVHIISGLVISFIGPIITAELAYKFKFIDFFFNPTKYILKTVKNNGTKA